MENASSQVENRTCGGGDAREHPERVQSREQQHVHHRDALEVERVRAREHDVEGEQCDETVAAGWTS